MVKKLSEQAGAKYYNLRQVYPKEQVDALFFPDSHWNKRGHDFIATWLGGLTEVTSLGLTGSAAQ